MVGEPHEDLLERFVQGDQDALEVLFRRFAAEVHGWILRIVRDSDAAEDVLVESFCGFCCARRCRP
jgi:DNA-directed RNA polymerase specialized sigma24 family protein